MTVTKRSRIMASDAKWRGRVPQGVCRVCLAALLLMSPLALRARKSATALSMERQGMVDITTLDSTIQVSLMYARADNFTGRVLYADLREALLHGCSRRAGPTSV